MFVRRAGRSCSIKKCNNVLNSQAELILAMKRERAEPATGLDLKDSVLCGAALIRADVVLLKRSGTNTRDSS